MENKIKPLTIKIPRKAPKGIEDKLMPEEKMFTGQLNDQMVPLNNDRLDENDERALKKLYSEEGDLCLHTSNGYSVSLRNFYRNQQIFLMLSGPSLNSYDLSQLSKRGIMTMGVNNSWSIFKPNLWTSVDDPGNFLDIGWKDPTITKFVPIGHSHKLLVVKEADGNFRASQFRVKEMPGVYYFRRNLKFQPKRFLLENSVNWGMADSESDELGCKGGRSVMLASIKILHYLGFRTVYLLGADFNMSKDKQNYAFKQERTESSVNGNNSTYANLNKRFSSLLPEFKACGMNIYNCYKESGLTAFPHMKFEKAVYKASNTFTKSIDTEGWYDRKDREKAAQEKADQEKAAQEQNP